MSEPQVTVPAKLLERLKTMLTIMAYTDNQPIPDNLVEPMEKSRQFCEGFVGVKREEIAKITPEHIETLQTLELMGFEIKR